MKRFLPLLCLLFAGVAFAQAFDPANPCALKTQPKLYKDLLAATAYDCRPWPMAGTNSDVGTVPQSFTNSKGVVVWWFCKAMNGTGWVGTWRVQIAVATTEYLQRAGDVPGALAWDLWHAQEQADPLVAFQKVATERTVKPLNDPDIAAVWCPAWSKINASKPANVKQ